MKHVIRMFCISVIAAAMGAATPVSLTVYSEDYSGAPGETIGFGFTLVNFLPSWIVVTNSWFCDPGQSPDSGACAPAMGAYTDFMAANGTMAPPLDGVPVVVDEKFDLVARKGAGSFSIRPDAPSGQDVGRIVVSYDVWDGNPFSDLNANLLATDQLISAGAGIYVLPASVPEPGTFVLAAVGLFGLSRVRRTRPPSQ